MNLSRIFIVRPIMTSLVMAAFVIFGWIAFKTLPINDLPNVDFPTLLVTATLPGANPDTMASAVATPLETPICHHCRFKFNEFAKRHGANANNFAI